MLVTGHILPRARRFEVRMNLRYRPNETGGWQEGATENISRSGLLFRSESLLKRGTPFQMILTLPAEKAGQRPVHVACLGTIVRMVPRESAEASNLFAARFVDYEFIKTDP